MTDNQKHAVTLHEGTSVISDGSGHRSPNQPVVATNTPRKMTQLEQYLAKPRDFKRGVTDCCRFAADWAELRCGRPVGASYRREMTKVDALRILMEGDGMVELFHKELLAASPRWVRVEDMTEGAVAVVKNPGSLGGETVGVVTKGAVVILNEQGAIQVMPTKTKIVAIWDLSAES